MRTRAKRIAAVAEQLDKSLQGQREAMERLFNTVVSFQESVLSLAKEIAKRGQNKTP